MDYDFFKTSSGKYSAKKMPAPKTSIVKIKDETDQDEFREDLRDYKPRTEQEFIQCYENFYDSELAYDIEIETLEEVLLANRKNWLGKHKWLSTYWEELINTIEGLEDFKPKLNKGYVLYDKYEAEELLETGVFESSSELSLEQWQISFKKHKVGPLREFAEEAGIEPKQKKAELVEQLAQKQFDKEIQLDIDHSLLLKPKVQFYESIDFVINAYLQDIKSGLDSFDYPEYFKASVWSEVALNHTVIDIESFAKAQMLEAGCDFDEPLSGIELSATSSPQFEISITSTVTEQSSQRLSKPQKIAFEYKDSKGNITFREIRLDEVESGDSVNLKGFCYLRNTARTFRADRIEGGITVVETGEYIPLNEFLLKHDINLLSTVSNSAKSKPEETIAYVGKPKEIITSEQMEVSLKKVGTFIWSLINWGLGVFAGLGAVAALFVDGNLFGAFWLMLACSAVLPPLKEKISNTYIISNWKGVMLWFIGFSLFGATL
ncbi:hypothetical protein [Pseudoalteromonas obscura]|uniref:SAP domain-containing protein n=1 Tax=Pseudoalteromonas obscura TaxID=3048491 RepID=A0ABT7ES80_9GAMM|nr:hypothetical protein [Pseudoalteromonas sp. P94(2023)]MDK2597930.1 hypothetical protein [Pseudoalteromonas sp. P94(2023)]